MDYSLKRTTEPASEPLSSTETKNHLRIPSGDTADDDKVAMFLTAARQQVERDIRRSLIQQTWTLKLDEFELSELEEEAIELHYGPVQSVTSVTYVDGAGSTQTVDSANYSLDTYSNPAVLRLTYSGTWPTHRGDIRGVTVTYVAGYANAAAVPAEIKAAILLKLESLYDGEAMAGSVSPVVEAYRRLVDSMLAGSYP